ncbi:MAG: hypothetical protein Q8S11_09580 [Daejeonella sp.]|uniref:beta strand repeat-containing protein n=1 Tax=Daejeonella sp. TaxID=2805397 RepID=UPI002732EC23|nr:hypothetical protein [Daejeonella sp.]MDP3468571.1 hypothetical protein [Daejeonella sp.]
MRPLKLLSIALMLAGIFFLDQATAQIKIGTNGANIQPSSLLELESANQGFLLPRMANTIAIDALNPPNGMMIYKTTDPAGLYIRKNNQWEYITGSMNGDAVFNSVTVNGPVTALSFSGPLTGNASTATLATTATNSNNSAVTNDVSNPGTTYPVFVNSTPGNQPLRTSSGNLSYVPATGILTARGFNGLLTGDVIGNASSSVDAQNTVNIRITDNPNNPATVYPTLVSGISGPLAPSVASTKLSFVPLTGELNATTFRGAVIGNASTATTVTGNVAAVNGGTGQTLYSPGDILFADASNTLARLPIGIQGTILRVDGTNRPSWSSAGAGTVRSLSGVANRISIVDPTVEPIIDISTDYIGQPSISTLGTVTTGIWNAGVIPTTYGGTGANAFISNEILIGRGTGQPIGSISLVGTAGKVLTSNGPTALPTFETAGIGDMVLGVDQTINNFKRFNDGTLILRGSGTGITTLKSDANTNGTITLPGGTRTLVSIDGNETLVNKTLTAPNLTGTANFQTLSGSQLIINAGTPLTTTNQTGTAGNIVMSNGPTVSSPTFTGTVNAGAITSTGTITATLFNGPASTANNTGSGGTLRDAGSIATAVDRANGATDAPTASRIVMRDANSDFSANVITANLAGNATNVTGVVAITNGGTGAGTKITAFNALSPMTSQGDLIFGGVAGTGTRLPIGSASQILKGGLTTPVWGSVVLTTDVSNVLPPANGGTGVGNTNTLTLTGADITLTATGATNITLPTTGTIATIAGTENLTSKTINGTSFTGTGGTLSLANGNTFTTVGANPITFTTTAPTTLTLPINGTLAVTASPAFTGTPTAPTAGLGTNTTQIATTAFVIANSGLLKFISVSPSAAAPVIAAGTEQEVDYPAVGASTTGTVVVSPEALPQADLGIMSARVSAVGVVTVRYRNFSVGPITPNVDLNITVIQ